MKIQFLAIALLLATVGVAEARDAKKGPQRRESAFDKQSSGGGRGQYMSGCGLGSLVIQDGSKWAQVGSAFLNGTGMQTFGISFGTSNCAEDGLAAAAREKDAFVEANLGDIRRDLSVGSGEYLSSLANLYGCKGEKAVSFNRALHKHQDRVLSSTPEQASHVIDSVVVEEKATCQG